VVTANTPRNRLSPTALSRPTVFLWAGHMPRTYSSIDKIRAEPWVNETRINQCFRPEIDAL
jgi:hypothetical protein